MPSRFDNVPDDDLPLVFRVGDKLVWLDEEGPLMSLDDGKTWVEEEGVSVGTALDAPFLPNLKIREMAARGCFDRPAKDNP